MSNAKSKQIHRSKIDEFTEFDVSLSLKPERGIRETHFAKWSERGSLR